MIIFQEGNPQKKGTIDVIAIRDSFLKINSIKIKAFSELK